MRIRLLDFANAGFRARQRSNCNHAFAHDRTLRECSDVRDAVQGASDMLLGALSTVERPTVSSAPSNSLKC